MTAPETPQRRALGFGLVWSLVGMLVVLIEGYTLGTPQAGDTLSEVMRASVRFTLVGRFVLLPLWCWLTWHWILRPRANTGEGRYDLIALAIGIVWAIVETVRA